MSTVFGFTLNFKNTEINISVRTIRSPPNNLTGRGTREIQIIENLIQEDVTTGLKFVIGELLLSLQEHTVIVHIGFVVTTLLVKVNSIITLKIWVSNGYSLLYFLFLAGFRVYLNFLKFLCLKVVLQFMVNLLTETLDYTTTIFLKALINGSISGSKSNISFTQNVVGRKNTGNGQSTKNNSRSIQFRILNTCLHIDDRKVLLRIFYGICFSSRSYSFFGRFMDSINRILSFFIDTANLGSCFTSNNGTCNRANNTSHNENFRTMFLELHNGLIGNTANALYDFILIFHESKSPFSY